MKGHIRSIFLGLAVCWTASGCFVINDLVLDKKCGGAIDPGRACSDPVSITSGRAHTCVLRNNQTAWCWGDHRKGQLGFTDKFELETAYQPRKVDYLSRVTSISAGWEHTCAVNQGNLLCWGSNWKGQLGLNPSVQSGFTRQATEVPGTENELWAAISSGGLHSCALTEEQKVWCWGDNRYGQTGQPISSASDWSSPKAVEGLSDVKRISTGLHHTCAHTDTKVVCWGQPNTGKTTRSPTDEMSQWHDPESYSLGVNFVDISAGKYHSCVAQDDGFVQCWGSTEHGQIGVMRLDETQSSTQTEPQLISWNNAMPQKIVQVAAGARHTCAIDENNLVYCWGGNQNYQLGDGTNISRVYPRSVGEPPTRYTAKRIAVGDTHACILDSNNGVACWGLNDFGQSGQPFVEGAMKSQREVRSPRPLTLPDPQDAEPPADDPAAPGVNQMPPPTSWEEEPALCITQLDSETVTAPESLAGVLDFPLLKEKQGSFYVHTATIALTNCGASELVIKKFGIEVSSQFSIEPVARSSTIAPGADFIILVKYEDTERSIRKGNLALKTNLPGQTEINIALRGRGLALPNLCYVQDGVDKGQEDDVVIDSIDPVDLTIKLCGNDKVPFVFRDADNQDKIGLNPGDADYTLTYPPLPVAITATQAVNVQIQYNGVFDMNTPANEAQLRFFADFVDPVIGDSYYQSINLRTATSTGGSTPRLDCDDWSFTHIAAGLEHTCVFRADPENTDKLMCWGNLFDVNAHQNNFRTPATASEINLSDHHRRLKPFRSGRVLKDIQAGEGYTCLLTEQDEDWMNPNPGSGEEEGDDELWCFGDARSGVIDGSAKSEALAIFGQTQFNTAAANRSSFENARNTSTEGYRKILDVAPTSDGMLYVAGEFLGSLQLIGGDCARLSSTSTIGSSGFLLKIDPKLSPFQGSCQWAKVFELAGGTPQEGLNSSVKSIAVDDADNVYLTGALTGAGDATLGGCLGGMGTNINVVNDQRHGFIAKYKDDGTCEWSKVFDGTNTKSWGNDLAYGMIRDPMNNTTYPILYVVGGFSSALGNGNLLNLNDPLNVTTENTTQPNAWLLMLNPSNPDGSNFGSSISFPRDPAMPVGKQSGSANSVEFQAITLDNDHNLVIAGDFAGERTLQLKSRNSQNVIQDTNWTIGINSEMTRQLIMRITPEYDPTFLGKISLFTDWISLDSISRLEVTGLTTDEDGNVYVVSNGIGTGLGPKFYEPWTAQNSQYSGIGDRTVTATVAIRTGLIDRRVSILHARTRTGGSLFSPKIFLGSAGMGPASNAQDLIYDEASKQLVMVGTYWQSVDFLDSSSEFFSFDSQLNVENKSTGQGAPPCQTDNSCNSSDMFVAFFDRQGLLTRDVFDLASTPQSSTSSQKIYTVALMADQNEQDKNHLIIAGSYSTAFELPNPSKTATSTYFRATQNFSTYDAFIAKIEPGFIGTMKPVKIDDEELFLAEEYFKIRQLRTGKNHACILSPGGGLACWGDNQYQQLGQNDDNLKRLYKPTEMSFSVANITQLSAGYDHNCFLTQDETAFRSVSCWGRNDQNQCGVVGGVQKEPAVVVDLNIPSREDFDMLSGSASDHQCFVTRPQTDESQTTLQCWGDNRNQQLSADLQPQMGPVGEVYGSFSGFDRPSIDERYSDLASGLGFTCYRGQDSKIYCWGRNEPVAGDAGSNTILGRESFMGSGTLAIGAVFDGMGNLSGAPAKGLAVGRDNGCTLREAANACVQEVWCWGSDKVRQRAGNGGNHASEITGLAPN